VSAPSTRAARSSRHAYSRRLFPAAAVQQPGDNAADRGREWGVEINPESSERSPESEERVNAMRRGSRKARKSPHSRTRVGNLSYLSVSDRDPNFRDGASALARADARRELTGQFLLRLRGATTTSCDNRHVEVTAICRLRSLLLFPIPPLSPSARCRRQPISRDRTGRGREVRDN